MPVGHPVAYVSFLQVQKNYPLGGMYYELRTSDQPLALSQTIYRMVHEAAPRVPVADLITQTRTIEHTFSRERTFADPSVPREVLVLGGAGLVIGSLAVWQTTVFLKSFLFGLQPNDPLTLTSAAAVLIICAILAGYVPA